PGRAPTGRVAQGRVGSENEEASEVWILAHYARGDVRRETAADIGPGLAVITGLEDVRPPVVELVAVDRDVGRAGIEWRHPDLVHPSFDVFGRSGEVAGHVAPRLPAVPGDLHEPVVRTHPDHVGVGGGEVDRENRI